MGYFNDKDLDSVLSDMEKGIDKAMNIRNEEEGFVNAWSFTKEGDILLFQEYKCGCFKPLNKITVPIDKKDKKIINEDWFIGQIEDLLLQANYKKDYDNLLINIKSYEGIKTSCEHCKKS